MAKSGSLAAAMMAVLMSVASVARGEVPAVKLASAAMITPADAWTYYGSFNQTSPGHTQGLAAWSSTPPEIKALARSLGGGGRLSADQFAQNALDYVRQNIDVEFRFGLGKGGRGALIDQSGTPFDQAELMGKLLVEGGISPGQISYQIGTITLTSEQFGRWTGLVKDLDANGQTFTVSAKAACRLLADGGIPALVNGGSDCTSLSGDLTSVTLGHIWLSVNGKVYDPSFKRLILYRGVDLAAVLQCGSHGAPTCGAAAASAVAAGSNIGTLSGVGYVENLNLGAVKTYLSARATALEAFATANLPTAKLEKLIGLPEIDPSYSPPADTSFAYPATPQFPVSVTSEIPDQWRTRLTVELANGGTTVVSKQFFADEIAGKRLQIFSVGGQFRLFLESQLMASVVCGPCSPTVSLTAAHPYKAPFANETVVVNLSDPLYGGSPATVVASFGDQTNSSVAHFADLEMVNPSPFVGASGPRPAVGFISYYPNLDTCTTVLAVGGCRSDWFASTATRMLAQIGRANRILGAISKTHVTQHHALGLIFDQGGPVRSDLGTSRAGVSNTATIGGMLSFDAASGSTTDNAALLESSSLMQAEMEGSVYQQNNNSPADKSALSEFAGYINQKVYWAKTSAEFSAIRPTLCPSSTYDYLQQAANDGYNIILTQGCSSVYAFKPMASSPLMTGGYKGASGPVFTDITQKILQSVQDQSKWSLKANSTTVDVGRGGLSLAPAPDIVTGSGDFPAALPFQRFYNSRDMIEERNESYPLSDGVDQGPTGYGQTYYSYTGFQNYDGSYSYKGPDVGVFTRLGGGWTHNYQITASLETDPANAMGERSALEASSFVAGLFTLFDLNRQMSLNGRVAAAMSAGWITSQFYLNTVRVTRPPSSETFLRLPSGAFSATPASANTLIQSGAPLLAPSGFDFTPVTFTWRSSDGGSISFDIATKGGQPDQTICGHDQVAYSCANPGGTVFKADDWTFPNGIKVHFDYIEAYEYVENDPQRNISTGSHYELTKVSNSLGRSLTFQREYNTPSVATPPHSTFNRLVGVTDDTQRSVQFQLENCPSGGSNNGGGFTTATYLACQTFKVVLPGNRVLKYEYYPSALGISAPGVVRPTYRLWKIYTPSDQNIPLRTIAYDDVGRVASITDNLTRTTSYFPGAVAGTERWVRGDVRSPTSAQTTQIFDQRNSVLQTVDPLSRKTVLAYDDLGRKTSETAPELNYTVYSYDLRSNLISATSYPKPGSSLQPIGTSSVYFGNNGGAAPEAVLPWQCVNLKLCNKLVAETDARNATTNYSWVQNTGDLQQVLGPAAAPGGPRPQSDFAYSSFTGPDNSTFTLLASKTDKISDTASVTTAYAYDPANKYQLQTATVDPTGLNLRTCFKFDEAGNLVSTTDPRASSCPP